MISPGLAAHSRPCLDDRIERGLPCTAASREARLEHLRQPLLASPGTRAGTDSSGQRTGTADCIRSGTTPEKFRRSFRLPDFAAIDPNPGMDSAAAVGARLPYSQSGGSVMARYTLYGFNASTYVRTVRMLLHEKGIEYDQVPVNILQGEGRSEAHLARHPFGKIPAFESDGVSLFETSAISEKIAPSSSICRLAFPTDRSTN
jgi:hypothetical protein